MRDVEQALTDWKSSLCPKFEIDALRSRNPVAHKWKAPFRSLLLRECVAWRTQDLLTQSLFLNDSQNSLGARILLRSAFETVAVLIYLNQLTRKVLTGGLNFHEFSEKTTVLLLGSRDSSTSHAAINIVTVIQKCNARYPGIEGLYAALSESAHPNYLGMSGGYSDVDRTRYATTFSNKWWKMYGNDHITSIELCVAVFHAEYNDEWADGFERLESWITQNDTMLEATKGKSE